MAGKRSHPDAQAHGKTGGTARAATPRRADASSQPAYELHHQITTGTPALSQASREDRARRLLAAMLVRQLTRNRLPGGSPGDRGTGGGATQDGPASIEPAATGGRKASPRPAAATLPHAGGRAPVGRGRHDQRPPHPSPPITPGAPTPHQRRSPAIRGSGCQRAFAADHLPLLRNRADRRALLGGCSRQPAALRLPPGRGR